MPKGSRVIHCPHCGAAFYAKANVRVGTKTAHCDGCMKSFTFIVSAAGGAKQFTVQQPPSEGS